MSADALNLIHRYISGTAPATHLSFFNPRKTLAVNPNERNRFWETYSRLARQSLKEEDLRLSIGQLPEAIMPIVARFRFKFDQEVYGPYEEDFCLALIHAYQQAMKEQLEISSCLTEMVCCLLEPETTYQDGPYKVWELVLHFPYCHVDATEQVRRIRPRVLQLLRENGAIARIHPQPNNSWDDIIDPMTAQSSLPLYRSITNPQQVPLELRQIFGYIQEEHIDDPDSAPQLELVDVFKPENHVDVNQGLIPMEVIERHEDLDFWLPLFFSIGYYHKATLLQSTDEPEVNVTANGQETDLEIALTLLPLLHPSRFLEENYWLDLGRALYNVDKGGDQGLQLWIQYTQRHSRANQSSSHQLGEDRVSRAKVLYSGFGFNNPLTIKTIAWFAREDNKDLYNDWHEQWCQPYLEKATSQTHVDVAEALYRVYWLDYTCAQISMSKGWYQFRSHRWVHIKEGATLSRAVSDEFLKLFECYRTALSTRIQESDDERFKKSAELTMKDITDLIRRLKNMTFKALVMRAAMERFHNEDFLQHTDADPNLMGIFNGVIQVRSRYALYRPGKPEDYITKWSAISWKPDLHWEHEDVKACLHYLRQVFPNEELRSYFLKLSAACLKGRNSEKIFPILTGEGDNSKSIIKKLFQAIFGTYSVDFPTSLVTSRRGSSSGPTPELAQAKGARIAFLQEPDGDDNIREGTLKELTGGDTFFARLLNEDGGKIEAFFKVWLMCNGVPTMPNADKATENRVRIIPFLSTWVDEAPESEAEQFKQLRFQKDPNFEDRVPTLAPALLWLLVEYYAEYISTGLKVPEIVKEHTRKYWEENDPYLQFINERITYVYKEVNGVETREIDTTARLTIAELRQAFTEWLKETHPDIKQPKPNTIKQGFVRRFGKTNNSNWDGIAFKSSIPTLSMGGPGMATI